MHPEIYFKRRKINKLLSQISLCFYLADGRCNSFPSVLISDSAKAKALKTLLHWDNSKLQGEIKPAAKQCEPGGSQRTSRDRECLNTIRAVGASTSYCSLNSCVWAGFPFKTVLEHPQPRAGFTTPWKKAEKAKVGELAGWGRARLHPCMDFLGMVSTFPPPESCLLDTIQRVLPTECTNFYLSEADSCKQLCDPVPVLFPGPFQRNTMFEV